LQLLEKIAIHCTFKRGNDFDFRSSRRPGQVETLP
jgi:hypothetical protein